MIARFFFIYLFIFWLYLIYLPLATVPLSTDKEGLSSSATAQLYLNLSEL